MRAKRSSAYLESKRRMAKGEVGGAGRSLIVQDYVKAVRLRLCLA